jgi:hypothetical protein
MTPLFALLLFVGQSAAGPHPPTHGRSPAVANSNAAQQPAARSAVQAHPDVTFQNGALTIQAPDNSLNDVLRAVSRETNVPIEGRLDGDERVAVKIGPAPLRDVLLTLLQGSHYSFVLLSKESQPQSVEKIVLMSRLSAPVPEPGQPQPSARPTINDVPIGTVISPDEDDPDAPPPPPRQPSVTGPDGQPIPTQKIINSTPVTPPPKNAQPATPEPVTPGPPK